MKVNMERLMQAIVERKFNFRDGERSGCPACDWFEAHKPDCVLMRFKAELERERQETLEANWLIIGALVTRR